MNILPFVMVMMMVIAFVIGGFFQNVHSLSHISTGFSGYMDAHRQGRNMLQKGHYRGAVARHKKKREKKEETLVLDEKEEKRLSEKTIQKILASRFESINRESAKLNIYLLFNPQDIQYPTLLNTFTQLLKELYGPLNLFPSEEDYLLLAKEIAKRGQKQLQKGKEPKAPITLFDLYPQNEPLKSLFYTLMVGTSSYDISTRQGLPSLKDFIMIDPSPKEKPICFQAASFWVLKAHFGQEITQQILKAEEKKLRDENFKNNRYALTRNELLSLVGSNTKQSIHLSKKLDLIQYNLRPKDPITFFSQDPTTQISTTTLLIRKSK
ncbi:MAG: hypothetical protein S4CHLAM102_00620 [Chlamydiia bacterium]|nr:hypothetical protein [Chlamydiia bacterium]